MKSRSRRDATPSRMMTIPEVAQYLHPSTLRQLIHRGEIPVFKIGNDYRFDRDLIEKWITDRQVKG